MKYNYLDYKIKSNFQAACQGDSGGPLFIDTKTNEVNGDKGRTLIGILSGGQACGRENVTNWWQRVSSFLHWIKCIKNQATKNKSTKEIGNICAEFVKEFETKFVLN